MNARTYARKWLKEAGMPVNADDVQAIAGNIADVADEHGDGDIDDAAQEVKSLIDAGSLSEYLDFIAWKSVMEEAA